MKILNLLTYDRLWVKVQNQLSFVKYFVTVRLGFVGNSATAVNETTPALRATPKGGEFVGSFQPNSPPVEGCRPWRRGGSSFVYSWFVSFPVVRGDVWVLILDVDDFLINSTKFLYISEPYGTISLV